MLRPPGCSVPVVVVQESCVVQGKMHLKEKLLTVQQRPKGKECGSVQCALPAGLWEPCRGARPGEEPSEERSHQRKGAISWSLETRPLPQPRANHNESTCITSLPTYRTTDMMGQPNPEGLTTLVMPSACLWLMVSI